jgi:hypothetical protein
MTYSLTKRSYIGGLPSLVWSCEEMVKLQLLLR